MWKTIEDFSNYEVSTEGQVRNVKTNRILKNNKNPHGRYQILLCGNGKPITCRTHRLVALAFIPNIEGKPEVDHIDRNPLNNNVSNLRWAARSENLYNRDYYHKGTKESQFISARANGSFQVRIRGYSKLFKTKEEAILHRDEFMKNNPC